MKSVKSMNLRICLYRNLWISEKTYEIYENFCSSEARFQILLKAPRAERTSEAQRASARCIDTMYIGILTVMVTWDLRSDVPQSHLAQCSILCLRCWLRHSALCQTGSDFMFYLSKTFSLIIDIKILFGPPGLAEHRGTNQMQSNQYKTNQYRGRCLYP